MWQLTIEYESFLPSVYFCRNPDDSLNKILLKDLCDDNYDAFSNTPLDDNLQNRIGNWDTIQNFMTYVSLLPTATVYFKFLFMYTHFVGFSVTISLKYIRTICNSTLADKL
jgi:hypothetical protein